MSCFSPLLMQLHLCRGNNLNPDKERQPRTREEMSEEASQLRPLFQ